jgi:hypothetical protein
LIVNIAEDRLSRMGGNDRFDVFLSYARGDGAAAAELNHWLRTQGLRTFFDRSELRPGLRWIPALEDAIDRCDAAAILVGRHGIGNTQQYERELALVRQTRDSGFPVIPVLIPGCENPPTGFLRLLTWIDLSRDESVFRQPDSLEALRGGNSWASDPSVFRPCADLPIPRPGAFPGRRCSFFLRVGRKN